MSRLATLRSGSTSTLHSSFHYFRHTRDLESQHDAIAEEARANAEALGALKLKVGLSLVSHGAEADVELVRRVREAVGPEVDANYAYDRLTAAEVGRELAALDVRWFEEPIRPTDHEGYAALRQELDVRVAGGECNTPAEFDRLLSMGTLDVAQPDVYNVGGLSPTQRVAARARDVGTPLVPHVWGTPIALAASLHLLSTLPHKCRLKFDRSANPLREYLASDFFVPDEEGHVTVPEGPGLGIELDEDAIDTYRID